MADQPDGYRTVIYLACGGSHPASSVGGMTTFFRKLWEQERPSAERADRKLIVDDAIEHLRMWADYGTPYELQAAINILNGRN